MIEMIELFLLLCLILLTFIDLRHKTLPSPLTTSIILILAIVKLQNIEFGIIAFIFGLLMTEGFTDKGQFFSGLADLKVTVMIGLMCSNVFALMLMIMLIMIYGTVYKAVAVKFFKSKEEIAFISVFLFVYVTLMILNYIGIAIF